jgi:aspartyl-tRNA(Asn)/glutamyl-tRNA(Gln) amidotransferase subunit A
LELYKLTIHELHEKIKNKEITAKDIASDVFKRIDAVEDKVKAYLSVAKDEAFKQTENADKEIKAGKVKPITGIPIAIKDNICIDGVKTTCASKILENFIPPYDATVITKLKNNGYVVTGKTNMDEFAMGSSTENSAFGATRNPYDLERVPGGSSGGSAAAVAADECIAALGSDTGGSIRQPAALCGVVGMKPTYGRVSRYGLVAFASSLDQIGPITKDIADCAIMMNVISGYDKCDSTSADVSLPDFTKSLIKDVKGLKIGIPEEYFIEGIDPEIEKSVLDAVRLLESLGAKSERIKLPHTGYAIAAYYILATSEASSNLARYDGVKYGFRAKGKDLIDMYMETRAKGFGSEVKRRIMLGTYALSAGYYEAYYKKGQQVRTLIKRDFDEAFKKVDVIITPTSPTPAFKIGEKTADPLQMYLSDIFTISVNLAGVPAASIPCGLAKGSLPIGLQIIAKPFDEAAIIKTAYTFEQSTDWHKKRPAI